MLELFRFRRCKDWAQQQAPNIRCCLVHALSLTKRSSGARSETILFVKKFIMQLLTEAGSEINNG